MWTIKSGNSLRINRENPPFCNRILFIFAYVELGRIILSMRRESGKETAPGPKGRLPKRLFFNRTKGD